MNPLSLTKNRLSKKQIVILLISSIVVLLVGWFAWWQFGPKPLGDRLEYIGRFDYGCLWICDSEPGSTYYYGTDMTLEEIKTHFSRGGYRFNSTGHVSGSVNYESLYFENAKQELRVVDFYENSQAPVNQLDLQPTTTKVVVGIDSRYYFPFINPFQQ